MEIGWDRFNFRLSRRNSSQAAAGQPWPAKSPAAKGDSVRVESPPPLLRLLGAASCGRMLAVLHGPSPKPFPPYDGERPHPNSRRGLARAWEAAVPLGCRAPACEASQTGHWLVAGGAGHFGALPGHGWRSLATAGGRWRAHTHWAGRGSRKAI